MLHVFILLGFQIVVRVGTVCGRLVQIQCRVLQAIFGWHLILILQSTILSQRALKQTFAGFQK